MRKILLITAFVSLAACQKTDVAANADATTNDVAVAEDPIANAVTPAAFDIKGTSWEFTDAKSKKPIQESVDPKGTYVASSGSEHIDHGTAVMKDGKACFTSAMTKEGEVCWTDPKLEIGASGETVSDKGEKLGIKRVAYVPIPAGY